MELASADAELKAALFRFVDVVPACRNLDDLARHLTGFLGEVTDAPPPIAAAMKVGGTKAGRLALGRASAAGVKHMAHRFIVGESPAAAMSDFKGLWKDGVAATVDLLGEATVTQDEAERYAARCAEALDVLVRETRDWPARPGLEADGFGPLPRANLSVKVSALTPLLRADAPERGKSDAAGPPAHAAAPGPRPRRAPAHRHGVAGLARRRHGAHPRAARRGGVRRRPVRRRRPAGLPARLARHRAADPRLGRAGEARRPAHRAPGQGRLLGPRARGGPPARLARPRLRGQGRLRPQLRAR